MGPRYRGEKKSDLDEVRNQLDSLMGINRNNDREKDQVKDYRDDRVCKFFLVGFCPYDLFTNTKMDRGPCTRIHSKELKQTFQDEVARGQTDISIFDSVVEREFQNRIQDIDRIIKKNQQKHESSLDEGALDRRRGPANDDDPETNASVLQLNERISDGIQQAEEKFLAQEYDAAQELLQRTDEYCKEKSNLLTKLNENLKRTGIDKKLRCCDICGSLLAILESDKRLADHFLGKQHVGFQYMRNALDVIRKRREDKRPRYRESSRDRFRRRDDSRDRSRDRRYKRDSRDRSRDRRHRRSGSRG